MRVVLAICILAMTFAATVLTAFVERPVLSQEHMKAHRTGYPLTFAVQDLSQRYNPETFPQYFAFTSPRDSPSKLELEPFIASWAILLGLSGLVIWLLSQVRVSRKRSPEAKFAVRGD